MHRQGAQVWGGDDKFVRLMRFAHPQVLVCGNPKFNATSNCVFADSCMSQVKLIDFSPNEKYLITYSSQEPSNPRDTHVREYHRFILLVISPYLTSIVVLVEGCAKYI